MLAPPFLHVRVPLPLVTRRSGVYPQAVVLSTVVPLTYVLMGGMRSSLFSDVLQAAMAVVFLFIILGVIGTPARSKWRLGGAQLATTDSSDCI